MEMHTADDKNVLLLSMPFAGTGIPSVQLSLLKNYLEQYNIDVETKHLYLKAAEIYGLKNYNFLINDSYAAQAVFSKYVFPSLWKEKKDEIEDFLLEKEQDSEKFAFESFLEKSEKFYNWVWKNHSWDKYSLVGFTLNYGQFLPSLALAKKIKEEYTDIKIVLGGSRTSGRRGVKTLKLFDFIDYVASGEGEKTLKELVQKQDNISNIPGLIYRKNDEIKWNKSQEKVDLDSLPFLDFDSFFRQLNNCSGDVKEYFQFYGRLPVEVSRGCWWNRCTFCNLNMLHKGYREKSSIRLVEEIDFLSNKYNMLSFQLLGSVLPKCFREFAPQIKDLDKDFSFFAEARAGWLKKEDYRVLKQAGFHDLQTGIESFSSSYLKKMNKGVRVIDNVAALKFCREIGINNRYNLVVGYPNEDENDFLETKRNISFFKHFINPPRISRLVIGFGCPIFNSPQSFEVDKLVPSKVDCLMFPKKILDEGISFYYEFQPKESVNNNWKKMVDNWKKERKDFKQNAIEKNSVFDKKVFFFVDGGSFIRVYDKRKGQLRVFILDEFERQVFLSCQDVVSFEHLQEKFSDVPDFKLAGVLRTFEKTGIVFSENNHFLSLPLSFTMKKSESIKKRDLETITA
ncbi:MAG: RiPP maturation radical SAM C-methyltransferase [Candidatus Thermoplasmatota archaeon]